VGPLANTAICSHGSRASQSKLAYQLVLSAACSCCDGQDWNWNCADRSHTSHAAHPSCTALSLAALSVSAAAPQEASQAAQARQLVAAVASGGTAGGGAAGGASQLLRQQPSSDFLAAPSIDAWVSGQQLDAPAPDSFARRSGGSAPPSRLGNAGSGAGLAPAAAPEEEPSAAEGQPATKRARTKSRKVLPLSPPVFFCVFECSRAWWFRAKTCCMARGCVLFGGLPHSPPLCLLARMTAQLKESSPC